MCYCVWGRWWWWAVHLWQPLFICVKEAARRGCSNSWLSIYGWEICTQYFFFSSSGHLLLGERREQRSGGDEREAGDRRKMRRVTTNRNKQRGKMWGGETGTEENSLKRGKEEVRTYFQSGQGLFSSFLLRNKLLCCLHLVHRDHLTQRTHYMCLCVYLCMELLHSLTNCFTQ